MPACLGSGHWVHGPGADAGAVLLARAAASPRLSGNISVALDSSSAPVVIDVLSGAAAISKAILSMPGVGSSTTVTVTGDADQGMKIAVGWRRQAQS